MILAQETASENPRGAGFAYGRDPLTWAVGVLGAFNAAAWVLWLLDSATTIQPGT